MNGAIDNFSGVDLNNLPSIVKGEIKAIEAPLVIATPETLVGYGRIEKDFKTAHVDIVPWPVSGKRPLVPGTGNEGGYAEDVFEMFRKGDIQYARNKAINRFYITGWFSDPATASTEVATYKKDGSAESLPSFIYTHEANYHPDGGQLFFPKTPNAAFVLLLAKPGDDVQPQDFVAFYCDGSFGVQILPGVWHQPAFPLEDNVVMDNRQGKVHACVSVDFITEFGAYVTVPLRRPQ